MDLLNRAFLQLADRYRAMTPGLRMFAILLVVVMIACAGYLSLHPADLTEVDLMHGLPLSAGQLPAMEAAFAKANLKSYAVRGMSIHVPRGQEADYMAALASAGALPQNFGDSQRDAVNGGSMFEFGSQHDQRMQIAKQQELAYSISQMPGIAGAYVLYDVDKRPGPFKDKVITACAVVKPEGAGQLEPRIVSAIRTMVARSFAGLAPENVAVTDLSAGRTWDGDFTEAQGADPHLHIALKRSYEQDLKSKILDAIGYIPNVTVVTNVELSQDAKAEHPVSAKVFVRVPMSFFEEILRQRNPASSESSVDATSAEIDRNRDEETKKIQKLVAQLLPATADGDALLDRVVVTTFQDRPAEENLSSARNAAIHWALQSWQTLVAAGLGLICLFILWRVVHWPAANRISNVRMDDRAAGAQPDIVPAPHASAFFEPSDSYREDIAELVKENPDAAVNVLRNWIGQVS